jgi:hypothetical protein
MSILRSKHSGWTWEGRHTPLGGGKGGGAPPPPDYAAAAQATAQGNLEAARVAAAANRVNQVTPYGTLTYSQNRTPTFNQQAYETALNAYNQAMKSYQPPTGEGLERIGAGSTMPVAPNYQNFMTTPSPDEGWVATQTLAPAQQELLDIQNALSIGTGKLGQQGLKYVENMISQPFDTSKLPSLGINPSETYTDAYMRRLAPMMQQSREALEQNLANQGIGLGSEAYDRAMRNFEQKQNDLMLGAATQGFGVGQAARQLGFNELAYQRNEPLNTLNAVRSGAQVTSPSFVNVPLQATTAGPDLLGAANAQYANQMAGYNANQAANANMMGGLMGLGGQLGGAYILGSAMSDPRTKENIKPIGVMENGLTLYSFEYKDEFKDHKLAGHGVHVGVMADEVEQVFPYAVSTLDDGYKVVNYGLLP